MKPSVKSRTHTARNVARLGALVVAMAAAFASSTAMSGAVIYNNANPDLATLALGVNDQGHLNFSGGAIPANASAMGLAYRFADDGSFRDATAPGCLCEGWGVAVTTSEGARASGFASVSNGGIGGLTAGTFSSNETRATSQVGLAAAPIVITHAYGVSLSSNLFQANVTITNTGSNAVSDVVYRRAMDWDVPRTEFREYVTHSGVVANLETAGGNVRFASNNGFAQVDPVIGAGEISLGGGGEGGGGEIPEGPSGEDGGGIDVPTVSRAMTVESMMMVEPITSTINIDFVDAGPADQGSVFDFAFGGLAAGESRTFNIFYGAAANEAAALAAIAMVNPTVHSLGQSTADDGSANNDGPTFIFAFGGVGGVAPGSDPTNPLLPFVDTGTGVMTFENPAPRLWYDPPFAIGYTYALTDGAKFTEVRIIDGFGDLQIRLPDGTLIDLPAGTNYVFGPDGPSTFDIIGLNIDTGAPGYVAGTAFPTFLDFAGDPSLLTMTAILAPTVGGSVPIPGTVILLITGLGLLGFSRRQAAARRSL